jgi:hypothetical protein
MERPRRNIRKANPWPSQGDRRTHRSGQLLALSLPGDGARDHRPGAAVLRQGRQRLQSDAAAGAVAARAAGNRGTADGGRGRRGHGERLRRFRPQPELRESRRTQRRPDRLQPPHRRPGAVPVRTGRDRHRGGGSPADSRPGRSSEWCLRFVRWRRRSRDTKTVGAPQTPDVPLAGNLSGTDSSANIFRGRWPVSSDRDARAAACRVR